LAWLGLLACWLVWLAWLGLLVCAWQKRTASIRHSAASTTTDVPLGADRARLHRGKVLSRMYIIWA
jgi:4-amino-4-deoxy-L-arabinose transferase-like glycosyltransferase